MGEKRGLFQKIFGKKKDAGEEYSHYKLLNSWQTAFVPFSGNAYEVSSVRSSVDSFARRVATVKPRHIRRGEGKISDVPASGYNRLLQFRPNPYTTAYAFYYRIATQYKIYNNAFVYPVWGDNGKLEALYNINASSIELLEYGGEMYCRMTFASGNRYTCPYSDIIHIRRHYCDNDIFGSGNTPITAALKTADTFNQSMSKFAELVAVVRGILKISGAPKDEDLISRRDAFIRDNLRMDSNGGGIVVTDHKTEYVPIASKETPIPTGQLNYIKTEVYDYFGTNEKIVQNCETAEEADAFFNGEILPFFEQCAQAFTNAFFSGKEPAYGNEIIFEGNRLQNAKLSEKTSAVKLLCEIGAIMVDEVREIYNMAPIGGEEGRRRIQTLNYVNANYADEYQLGAPPKKEEEE